MENSTQLRQVSSLYGPGTVGGWLFTLILYEITEFALTCSGGIGITSDIEPYLQHIDEMLETGVQATLAKHGYRCSYDRDRQYMTSWMELLVLLRRLHFSIFSIRKIMDSMT